LKIIQGSTLWREIMFGSHYRKPVEFPSCIKVVVVITSSLIYIIITDKIFFLLNKQTQQITTTRTHHCCGFGRIVTEDAAA
jgi:hypothetical protein